PQNAAEQALRPAEPRVAAGYPRPLVPRLAPHDRHEVGHEAEQACPAMRHDDRPADQVRDETLERALDLGRRLLARRELVVEVRVAEAAGEDPPILALLPVVEAVTAVVRAVEEPLGDRLAGDHLSACRDD